MKQPKKLFDGKFLKVELVEGKYEVVRRPQAVGALVYWIEVGDFVLVKHRRPAIGSTILEIVAGLQGDGETLESTVAREVTEETGLRAVETVYLGSFYLTPGYSDEVIHLYFVKASGNRLTLLDNSEELEPVSLRIDDIWRAEIRDAKTLLALLLSKEKNCSKTMLGG